MSRRVFVWHLHRSVDLGKGLRGKERFAHRCYWNISEDDGSPDGRYIGDVVSTHEDARTMAGALGEIVEDDHNVACPHRRENA